MRTIKELKSRLRELGHALMQTEVSGAYCEDFIEKRKEHDRLLERLYRLEKRVF
jgi:hypothetical protein